MRKECVISYGPVATNIGVWLLVAYILFNWHFDCISPDNITRMCISCTVIRINIYIREHGFPPKSLSDMPERKGYNNSLLDGWGNQISYCYDSKTSKISLVGYGERCKSDMNIVRPKFIFETILDKNGEISEEAILKGVEKIY